MTEFVPTPINLQGKAYLEVAQRVFWLRQEQPGAQIITDLIEHDAEAGRAVVRATINIPASGATATGYGTANRKDLRGPVAAAYLEKAETRAIGRACALLGYGTLAALAADDADGPADAPQERKQPPTPTTPQEQPTRATPAQLARIKSAVSGIGMAAGDCTTYLAPYGVSKFGALSEADAEEVAIALTTQAAHIHGDAEVASYDESNPDDLIAEMTA